MTAKRFICMIAILSFLCVGGLLYRYACRYLERRYDLREEKRSLDLR
ncbi:Uncharacterised protein [uncultured Eubacterium sp.]|nr:Uncharacterised protein [uncultured Eubacterium sp.]